VAVFMRIFTHNVLPTFVVVGLGVLLDRIWHVDIKTLSRTAIYVLAPCFVFSSIVESQVGASEFGLMIAYVVALTLLLVVLGLGVGKLLHWPARQVDALILSVAFINSGNFGLSIILFSFGQEGVELATVFFVASSFVVNTVAAFIAARGGGSAYKALSNVVRLPGIYGFLLALLVRGVGAPIPTVVMEPLRLVARALVPIMLLMLGIQLSQTSIGKRYKDVAVGVGLRLVVGALLAAGLAGVMGLRGLAAKVAITQASTPTAVNSALMAIEFDAAAEFVTSAIFISTLLSSVTLTVVLAILA